MGGTEIVENDKPYNFYVEGGQRHPRIGGWRGWVWNPHKGVWEDGPVLPTRTLARSWAFGMLDAYKLPRLTGKKNGHQCQCGTFISCSRWWRS